MIKVIFRSEAERDAQVRDPKGGPVIFPASDEWKELAYSEEMYTTEDADMSVADSQFMDLFLGFASDPNCPNKDFFLRSMSWYALNEYERYRSPNLKPVVPEYFDNTEFSPRQLELLAERKKHMDEFDAWFAKAESIQDADIQSWCKRVNLLFAGEIHPNDFV